MQAVGALRTEISSLIPGTDYEDVGALILQAKQGNQGAFERLVIQFLLTDLTGKPVWLSRSYYAMIITALRQTSRISVCVSQENVVQPSQ